MFNLVSDQIPEVKITDQNVITAINKYLTSDNHLLQKSEFTYHLMISTEMSSSQNIIVGSVASMSAFIQNIPDSYSIFGNRLIFWYEHNTGLSSNEDFQQFYRQFEERLILNCNIDGSDNFILGLNEFMDFKIIAPERYVVRDGVIVSSKKVCRFPDRRFKNAGFVYDESGDLRFKDGSYDPCSLDQPFSFVRDGYNPAEYIRNESNLPPEFFNDNDLAYFLTINEEGRAVKAELYHNGNNKIDTVVNRQLTRIILNMPKCNVGYVNGKKVTYRILIGL